MNEERREIWTKIQQKIQKDFNKKPDLNAILFLIGIRELGTIPEKAFSKTDKVGLIHIAVCRLLSQSGYYSLVGHDNDGWPHWKLEKPLPHFDIFEQETFLREHIIEYFENEELL